MQVLLYQLNQSELQTLVAGQIPHLPYVVDQDSLPREFILRRAAEKLAEGKPPQWWLPFLIIKDTHVAGGCAFKGEPSSGRVEILYGVSKQYRRQGIAAIAIKMLVTEAINGGAIEVLAEIEPKNTPSLRTAEKCGFSCIGTRLAADGVIVAQYLARCAPNPLLKLNPPRTSA
jgi:[ribosomal protein S5]-alanine N-acetyltransferase